MAKKTTSTKITPKTYLEQQQKLLITQRGMHISKREGQKNLVYLNAQIDFIAQMKEANFE